MASWVIVSGMTLASLPTHLTDKIAQPVVFPLGVSADDGTSIEVADGVRMLLPADADRYALRRASYVRRILRWSVASPKTVVSHTAAAALHGLPADAVCRLVLHGTRPGPGGSKRTFYLWRHSARLADDEILEVGPIRLTTVVRTIVDIAKCEEAWRAVAIADAALHRKLLTPDDLDAGLGRIAGQPGSAAARAALALADGRAESVGESRMRVALHATGLPEMELQFDVRDRFGAFIGRVDAGYPARAVALEFDGEIKYGTLLKPGQTRDDVLREQHQREDALVVAGFVVVRVRWTDLDEPPALAGRIREALAQGDLHVRDGLFTAQCRRQLPARRHAGAES